MRVIYVTAALPRGTDEAFIVPEIRELARLGHDVLVVPRSPKGNVIHGREVVDRARQEGLVSWRVIRSLRPGKIAAAVPLLRGARSRAVRMKNLAVVPKAIWLADLAGTWRADHIHCHWAGTTATMAMLASRISGVPWSLTLHRWDIVENNLLAAKARDAAFVRFISEDGVKMALRLGVDRRDLDVIHMGVSVPAIAERASAARPVVLCPARLVEVKGHRYLFEAWKRLSETGVRGELWLAGNGELRARLEAMAMALGIARSVRFLGAVPHGELLKMYKQGAIAAAAVASVDLGSGYHEGIPVALMEAMSYGIPVVSTSTGGTPELIQPGTGILVKPQDSAGLAAALGKILSDHAFAGELGRSGRQRVLDSFDITRIAAELADRFAAIRPAMVAKVA